MSYQIETKIAPKASWFTPAEAKAYYGSYARHGVTVHWWGGGEGADQHDNIVNYFMKQGAAGIKSVNYVVSDKKITKMVEPQNVAWASQNGNPVTISIEFQPTLSAEGYKRGGWLIAELEKKYGRLELYKHSFWFPTSCPGTINLSRLRSEADLAKKGTDIMPTEQDVKDYFQAYVGKAPTAAELSDYTNKARDPHDAWRYLMDKILRYVVNKSSSTAASTTTKASALDYINKHLT